MSDSDSVPVASDNALYRLAAVAGLLLGLLFLMGAYGHFAAVSGAFDGSTNTPGTKQLSLLLPGLMLVGTGLINIALCGPLWTSTAWALQWSLLGNAGAAAYLVYLMNDDLPGHPVGSFLALAGSHLVLLGAIRAGLVWPARGNR